MKHTLQAIYGKENYESENFLYSDIKNNISNGKYSYILVPEQYSLSSEREFLSKIGLSAQKSAEVLTFSRLCNIVLSEAGPLRGNYIDNAGKHILIKRALQLNAERLRYFTKSVNKQGFTGVILSVISEFKRYGVTPEILLKASGECAEENLAKKLYDFSVILESFNKLTNEKYSNSEDNLEIITPRIPMCSFNNGVLYICFFKSFTPLEYQAIENLMQVMDVKILLCADSLKNPSEIFETAVYTYKKLCGIAENSGIEIKEPAALNEDKEYRRDELNHLADIYFKITSHKPKENPSRLHILNPPGFYKEVQETALLINSLCKEYGYKYSDFLILAGDLSAYTKFIPKLFERYGISYFIDKKEPVLKTPVYKLISYLLETAVYGFSYERVMSVARLMLLPVSMRDADMLDNYLLAVNVNYKMWNTDKDWTYNPNEQIFDMDCINNTKNRILKPVNDFISALSGRKTVNDICVSIGNWLNENKIADKLKTKARVLENKGKLSLASKYKGAWNSLISQLSQINDILGDTFITYEKFREIFISSASQISIGAIPQTLDEVMISEISHFRNTTAEAVIVLGVNDGVFPRNFPIYGILSDIEREELKNLNIELAPTAISKQLEERYHIFNVLRTARSQLYLSVPKCDTEGKSCTPSPVIKRLKKLYKGLEYEVFDENSPIYMQDKTAAFDILLRKADNQSALNSKWELIKKEFIKTEEYKNRLSHMGDIIEFSKTPEQLSKQAVTKLYGKQLSLSISRLEQFNQCAFAYFMKYGLYLSPRLKADFRSNDMGSALHLILSEYFKRKAREDADYGSIKYDEVQNEIYEISENVTKSYNSVLYDVSAYYRYLTLKIRGIASAAAWEIVKFYKNSSFRPYGFEISIGGKNPDISAKTIKVKNGTAKFSGFIDRADYCRLENKSYMSILDYKSSEKKLNPEHIENGIQLQPLAYMNAICESVKDAEPAAMLYMHLNDPILSFDKRPTADVLDRERQKSIKLTGWALNTENILSRLDKSISTDNEILSKSNVSRVLDSEFKDALNAANEKIRQSTEEIFEGRIDIKPYISSDFNSCEYCDYSPICTVKNGQSEN